MPQFDGASYAIFRDGKEILADVETIPFGTNNVGEFKDYLLGLKSARGLGSYIQIVGNCIILTKAAPKNYNTLHLIFQKSHTFFKSLF